MVFGYETGTINVIVPDSVRFSSTLIFITELVLVFAALFILSVLIMSTLQSLLKTNPSPTTPSHPISERNDSSLPQQQTELLLKISSESNQIAGIIPNIHDITDNNNIFYMALNKTKNVTIWSYLVFFSSLITTIYYLLMFTTIIVPSNNINCTQLLQIGNALLIFSRFTLYFYWNEYLLYSTSVYLSYYIFNNELLRKQYPLLKPIKSLSKFKKKMRHLQHDLNQNIHNRYSDGEQYLYYKVFFKYYMYRFFIILWMMIYLIGLLIYTNGETYYLTIDSNKVDEDGIICKEIFDTLSAGMLFYTFGIIADIMTIFVIIDEYILSLGNNLQTILKNQESFNQNIFILLNIKKNVTLALISMITTLLFRLLSFVTGLEATFYPLSYTINILTIFLLFRFNTKTYQSCCGEKMERLCFYISFKISMSCCRYTYRQQNDDKNIINTKVINQKLKQIQESKQIELEIQLTEKNYL